MLVTPVSTTDRDAARILLPSAKSHFRRLSRIWADGGYTGHLTDWAALHLGLVLDVVRRSDDARGFRVLLSAYGLFSPVAYGPTSPALAAGSGSTAEDLG
ncbi:hypothetical protein ACIF80_37260 [Streptomyces sp. NPDC085927]|uniref:hypothetical protein n=1 Tax=Streptomyces sp. NPDC085927 TaxID=3365738 RepID=UPI0037CE98A6